MEDGGRDGDVQDILSSKSSMGWPQKNDGVLVADGVEKSKMSEAPSPNVA